MKPISNFFFHIKKISVKRAAVMTAVNLASSACLFCCSGKNAVKQGDKPVVKETTPYDGKEYLEESSLTEAGEDLVAAAAEFTPINNFDTELSVPTYITKVDDTWFIVDCYHNRVIYSKELGAPLTSWLIMSSEATQPHTMASDGHVYVIDDTENNRVLIYEKEDDKYLLTQRFNDIGTRPHYTVYDKDTDTFYVWSSITGELFCFRREASTNRVYLTDKRVISCLDGIYVRSFSIIDGDIYFVSGVSDSAPDSKILKCNLETLEIEKEYPVPDELAGMVQLTKAGKGFLITISTDKSGAQDKATIVQTDSLEALSKGKYTDVYADHFIGGGTPYYISNVDDTFFLTEHRIKGHSIWSFKVDDKDITDVTAIY